MTRLFFFLVRERLASTIASFFTHPSISHSHLLPLHLSNALSIPAAANGRFCLGFKKLGWSTALYFEVPVSVCTVSDPRRERHPQDDSDCDIPQAIGSPLPHLQLQHYGEGNYYLPGLNGGLHPRGSIRSFFLSSSFFLMWGTRCLFLYSTLYRYFTCSSSANVLKPHFPA